jgi:hypothetical protein
VLCLLQNALHRVTFPTPKVTNRRTDVTGVPTTWPQQARVLLVARPGAYRAKGSRRGVSARMLVRVHTIVQCVECGHESPESQERYVTAASQ